MRVAKVEKNSGARLTNDNFWRRLQNNSLTVLNQLLIEFSSFVVLPTAKTAVVFFSFYERNYSYPRIPLIPLSPLLNLKEHGFFLNSTTAQ